MVFDFILSDKFVEVEMRWLELDQQWTSQSRSVYQCASVGNLTCIASVLV